MASRDEFKKGLRVYRLGFGWGVVAGCVLCLVTGTWLYSLPLVLGLLAGASAFQLKMRHLHKTKKHD